VDLQPFGIPVLIVGDVHGTYYTLRNLLRAYWQPEEALLIQLGDLINKGPHSAKCLRYWQKLEKKYPGRTVLLRGNHEHYFLKQHRHGQKDQSYWRLRRELEDQGLKAEELVTWLSRKPLTWHSAQLFVSHAGLAAQSCDPFALDHPSSVLNNRGALAALPEIQIVGHQMLPEDRPLYKSKERSWYIDTGAWQGRKLTALYFSDQNMSPQVRQCETDARDLEP